MPLWTFSFPVNIHIVHALEPENYMYNKSNWYKSKLSCLATLNRQTLGVIYLELFSNLSNFQTSLKLLSNLSQTSLKPLKLSLNKLQKLLVYHLEMLNSINILQISPKIVMTSCLDRDQMVTLIGQPGSKVQSLNRPWLWYDGKM